MIVVAYAIAAFLIGSIPFGYVIGRFIHRTDIREQGSGNIGAMNTLRTFGKTSAIAVLLLDAAKGFVPTFILAQRTIARDDLVALVAIAAVLGHCFSPWLGWRGGKGVATAFGAIFALSWQAGLVSVATWILGALVITQFSSVGSILATLISPFALFAFTGSLAYAAFGFLATLLVIYTHRENIARLRAGSESRIRLFKSKG